MTTSVSNQVFNFIRDTIERCGESPTLEQIGDEFGFSKPRACVIINELEAAGRVRRYKRGRRKLLRIDGVELIDLGKVGTDNLRAELARRGVTFEALDTAPRPFAGGSPCAANHCRTHVQPGHLMCRPHWLKLPPKYRSDILNAWRARHLQAFGEALERARDFIGGYTRVVERVE